MEASEFDGGARMKSYGTWFEAVSGTPPYAWQATLAQAEAPADRLLRIPTGFGKTAGTALAWLFHRCVRNDDRWPRRLVFCLPMRVLVEQTETTLKAWVKAAGLDVNVVVLIGGREIASWLDDLDKPTILIGTQDMLLSRAMNRGYASARALWPMELGALHSDALWVIDEIQLMDTGLATTTQLAAFRRADAQAGRPVHREAFTWWMSATLQPSWLGTVDFRPHVASLPQTRIAAEERSGGLWEVAKAVEHRSDVTDPAEIAKLVLERHTPRTMTLVIVNTVDRALSVVAALSPGKKGKKAGPEPGSEPEVKLVHSRFRGHERRGWDFLTKATNSAAALPEEGRIIVATQVVEAGVDMSAKLLVTDLAPWSSLVQRFGRCARYAGEQGNVIVVGAVPAKEADARPYDIAALRGSADSLAAISKGTRDVGPRALETYEEALEADNLAALYPYTPEHVLRRKDFDELFDTSPDLSGADLDVGRYIRSGEDRDASVFWRRLEDDPKDLRDTPWPTRDELCPVPAHQLQEFLKKSEAESYTFDFVQSCWKKRPKNQRVVPGTTILLRTGAGGYHTTRGWDESAKAPVEPVERARPANTTEARQERMVEASLAGDDDPLAELDGFKTIRLHGHEARAEVDKLARAFALDERLATALSLAARWHDAGKAHPTFQSAIRETARNATPAFGNRGDLAKAPKGAFAHYARPGFRHELASGLMLFEVLRRRAPNHAALLGPHQDVLELLGTPSEPVAAEDALDTHPLADELAGLSADDIDLVAYLVVSHHGKVRGRWASTPRDIEDGEDRIHGVADGDAIPAVDLPDDTGAGVALPRLTLSLAMAGLGLGPTYGASWTDRVERLLASRGPFSLAFLEAILRVADWRASALPAEVLP